jgi:hypothetical protein
MDKNNNKVWVIIKAIFIAIYQFFYAIKFIFSIPLLTICASVFTFCFIMLVKPLINFLPDFLNTGLIETLIAAGIFIGLKFLIFNDKLQHDFEFKHYQYIISFAITFILWMIPIVFFIYEGENAQIFLADGKAMSPLSLVYVFLYSPHMWLATLTKEFTYSVGAGLVINGIIFTIIALLDVRVFLRGTDKEEKAYPRIDG